MKNMLTGKLIIDTALAAIGVIMAVTQDSVPAKIVGGIFAAAGLGDGYCTVKELKKISTEENGVF